MRWLDAVPLWLLGAAALLLGLAPFVPEPHLWEKLRLLAQGGLSRPIDIFDLLFHASGPLLFALRFGRWLRYGRPGRPG